MAAEESLHDREYSGFVTAAPERVAGRHEREGLSKRWRVMACDHPLATKRNVEAATLIEDRVRTFAATHAEHGVLLVLISGGGSAHLTLPAQGIPLEGYVELQRLLMREGATIEELNAVRKHAERLKGGQLATIASGLDVRVLVLSDVVGDRSDVIASGPLAPDPTTFADAIAVLRRRHVVGFCPEVDSHLAMGEQGHIDETPKRGDTAFARVSQHVIASNATAIDGVSRELEAAGVQVTGVRRGVVGEAADVGRAIVRELQAACLPATNGSAQSRASEAPTTAIVWGGEPTVTVGAMTGRGGPSQEVALAAALELERRGMQCACVISLSTDGIDGPTENAGGIGDAELCHMLRAAGQDPDAMLGIHDSATAMESTGRVLKIGPTGTNVNHVFAAISGV